jgi:hypothetical protein
MTKPATPRFPTPRAPRSTLTRAGVPIALVAVIVAISAVVAVATGFDRTQGGEVAVIRNGGPLDNHKVRQVVEPASALTWIGMWSQSHKYPAQRVASAKADADANAQRQRGYQDCPACAQIDTLKAIPPNVTTFAPGSGFAVTQPK